MVSLAKILARRDMELKLSEARENVNTSLSGSTEDRLAAIETEIGEEVLAQFAEQNKVDLKVYDIVKSWYG